MEIRQAFLQTLISHQLRLAVMLVGMAVLGRTLLAEDFGLFATALAVLVVGEALADFGLSAFLIRKAAADPAEYRTAAGVSLILSFGVAAIITLGTFLLPEAPWAEGLQPVLLTVTLALLVRPIAQPLEARLQRDLQFGYLAIVAVCRLVVQTSVAIALAVQGFGALALAIGLLADYLVWALMLALRGGVIRPSLAGWREFLGFGQRYTAANLLPNAGNLVVLMILGGALGVSAIGLYNRAQAIVQLLNRTLLEGIAPVVLPALSRSLEAGVAAGQLYRTKTGHLAVLCWPGFLAIAIMAEPLVLTLLGPSWAGIITAVRLLALLGLAVPFTKMSMKFFVALNQTGTFLRITAIHQGVRLGLAGLGALHSLEAACLGLALAHLVKAALLSSALKPLIEPHPTEMRALLGKSAAVAGLTGLAAGLALSIPAAPLGSVILGGAAAVLAWSLGLRLTRHPLWDDIRQSLGRRRTEAAVR